MRIGVNTLFLVPGDVGGTEVYLRSTIFAMADIAQDHDFVLFTNRENDALLRRDLADYKHVEFFPVPCRAAIRPLRILAEQFLLPLAAKKRRVDVLWSPGYTAPAVCPSPQVVTICDLQYMSYPEDMSAIERKTLDVLVRTACRRCQAVITISEFSRQEVVKYKFCAPEKVFAVPLGVSSDFSSTSFSAQSGDSLALSKSGVEKPFILCVAHTYPHKNIDKLIEAFAQLEDSIPHQLVLVGKARRGEKSVQDSIKLVRNGKRIIRLSGVTKKLLQTLYQEADIFVLPSSYEGFGLPVLEAMMASVPVIAPKLASLPEVGGEYIFYVEFPEPALLAKQIVQVINLTDSQRNVRIHNARKWAEAFTWKRTAQQTMKVLQSIAGKNR